MSSSDEDWENELTPKQRAFEKLSALASLAKHVGLIAPCKSLALSEAVLEERLAYYGSDIVDACISVMLDDDADPVRRAACGILLECFVPGWRDIADPRLVGMLVERDDREVHLWRRSVLKRDGFKCQECGATNNLHAHHIVRWVDAPMLRVFVENGVTLCEQCHVGIHAARA